MSKAAGGFGRVQARARSLQQSTRHKIRPLTAAASTKCVVTDSDIARLAMQPLHPLTLADLVKHGPPPLSSEALFESANFALSILPTRLAHRIQKIRALPYIVVMNSSIAQIHQNYVHSLSTLLPFAERGIQSMQDDHEFTEALAGLVRTHTNTIPVLAHGFLQSRSYIHPVAVRNFLNEHLRARIGTRLIAEQHIAHHDRSQPYLEGDMLPPSEAEEHARIIGVVDTDLQPASIVRNCESFVGEITELRYGVRPSVVINGNPETRIAHIPMHLTYIMTELLKNSFRAVIEQNHEREPIEVTIAPAVHPAPQKMAITIEDQGESASASTAMRPLDNATPGITIRIRDRGGGIAPEDYANIWDFSFTTFNESRSSNAETSMDGLNAISGLAAGASSIAGLGYGLPLSRAYAQYFGGDIAVQNLHGYGCDVYLTLRGVGRVD